MKALNRTLLTLVLAIGVLLAWSALSRTGWATSVSLLGIGDNYQFAYQPIVKVVAMTTVMVSAVQLIRQTAGFIKNRRSQSHVARRSVHNPA